MPESWIVRVADKEYGPVDFDTLLEWKREGRVLPTNEVRREAEAAWITASEIPGLFEPPPLPPSDRHLLARRRTVGEIIRDSFRIYRAAFLPFFCLALLTAIPTFAFELTSPVYGIFPRNPSVTALTSAKIVALFSAVLLLVNWPIFLAGIQIASLDVLEGRSVRLGDLLRRAINFFPRFVRIGLIVYGSYFLWTAIPVLAILSLASPEPSIPALLLAVLLLSVLVVMLGRLWVNFLFWQQSAVVSNLDGAAAIAESKTLARSQRRARKSDRPFWRGALLASLWLVLVLGLSSGAEVLVVLSKLQNVSTPEQVLALVQKMEAAKTPDAMLIASAALASLVHALLRPIFGIAFVLLYFDARADFSDTELSDPDHAPPR
jgi:hypothetical protein